MRFKIRYWQDSAIGTVVKFHFTPMAGLTINLRRRKPRACFIYGTIGTIWCKLQSYYIVTYTYRKRNNPQRIQEVANQLTQVDFRNIGMFGGILQSGLQTARQCIWGIYYWGPCSLCSGKWVPRRRLNAFQRLGSNFQIISLSIMCSLLCNLRIP